MVDLMSMNAWHVLLYFILFVAGIVVIAIVVSYLKVVGKRKNDRQTVAPLIDYFKGGFANKYSSEDLVSYCMLNGWSLLDCNRALKYLGRKPV